MWTLPSVLTKLGPRQFYTVMRVTMRALESLFGLGDSLGNFGGLLG